MNCALSEYEIHLHFHYSLCVSNIISPTYNLSHLEGFLPSAYFFGKIRNLFFHPSIFR